MLTGHWGRPGEVLLALIVDDRGAVSGIANPGRQDAPVAGHFDAVSGAVSLTGEYRRPDGAVVAFRIAGHLRGQILHLDYEFGEQRGTVEVGRVEAYLPTRATLWERVKPGVAAVRRWLISRTRPRGADNARRLRDHGESIDTIVFRDAVASDIPALAELHVTTWNATYNTRRGPSVATRSAQWQQVFAKPDRRDFVLVLEDARGRLIGFTWGKPHDGVVDGELSKIYLRWEYHGLGLGRRMMAETARRFHTQGIRSFILFAELTNPTLGFYERLGGERARDHRGRFNGAYVWRDVTTLIR